METKGKACVVVDAHGKKEYWHAKVKPVMELINKLDPEKKDKEIRDEIKEYCKLRTDWKDPEYDTVSGGAPFYLDYLESFLTHHNRLPTAKERDKLWHDT